MVLITKLLVIYSIFFHIVSCPTPPGEYMVRQRCGEIRTFVFLDGNGNPKPLINKKINLNFFSGANASYIGTVTTSSLDSGFYYWYGSLDGISNGYFYVLYQGETWIIHAASPAYGVYEARYEGGDSGILYKIYEME